MDWFEKQIRLRKELEKGELEEALRKIADAVSKEYRMPRINGTEAVDRALEQILRIFRITMKKNDVHASVSGLEERIDWILRPYGIMHRGIGLTSGWYRNCTGPVLACLKKSGIPVAVLPNKITGYHFEDPETGKKIHLNKKTEGLLEENGICFYSSLPMRKLTVKDLLYFMLRECRIWDIVLLVTAMIAASLVGLLVPQLNKMLFSSVEDVHDVGILVILLLSLFLVTVTQILTRMISNMTTERIQQRQSVATQAAIIMRVLSMPTDFFRRFSAGELNQHIQSACMLCRVIMGNVCTTGLTVLVSIVYIIQVFIIVPQLAVPSMIITMLGAAFSIIAVIRQISVARKQFELAAKESGMTYSMISGVQKIKMTGSESRAFSRWADLHSKWASLENNPPAIVKYGTVIQTVISLTGIIVIYLLAEKNAMTVPDFMAFLSANAIAAGALTGLVRTTGSIANIRPLIEMAEPLLSAEPEVTEDAETVESLKGRIELDSVSFRYGNNMPLVIDNLSISIKEGEYVAIVGPTGCGKSTLIRLILGFEKPQHGTVTCDHRDIRKLDLSSYRGKMGIVTQEGKLFHGSIFSNIVIASPELTLDDAWNAAEIAGIADDIRAMPMGMNTVVGGGNGGLSGGQRQRIMIARAVVRNPKILIFDEATSALDNLTQKKVADATDRMHCTRIVIAHRLSTIRNCERIIVMDKGRIVEEGTYEELTEKNGFFARMVERQRTDMEGANCNENAEWK